MPPLADWANFYVIVGSSAAALTGLQFVVIALLADAMIGGGETEMSAFSTPNVVHFSAVLLISAICSMPHQSFLSLGICLSAAGMAGVVYAIIVASRTRRSSAYTPVLEDWLFHVILPFVCYGSFFAGGVGETRALASPLYVVAGASLLLLYVGIHNAWDTAVFISQQHRINLRAAASASTPQLPRLPLTESREDAQRSSPE